MPKSFVIDIRHYLNEQGNLPPLPAPAMAIALLCGPDIVWIRAGQCRMTANCQRHLFG